MKPPAKSLSIVEFVVMLSMIVSIVALSTDVMLPGLDIIGHDLGVADPKDVQLIVLFLFIGFSAGQVIAGPLSDSFGRKPVVYGGYLLFFAGCLLSIFAEDFSTMLAGRILQGLGAAGPRVVTLALVRDCYEGRAMARIMSFVMAVFILVPAIAPMIGLGLIKISGWRATFVMLLFMSLIACLWFAVRQPETLPVASRRPLSVTNILSGLRQACGYPATLGYTLAAGLIFGAFLGYLSSAQQIFAVAYDVHDLFAIYFGTAALAIGAGSIVNSRLVMKLGMRPLTGWALIGVTSISVLFLIPAFAMEGVPPLWLLMIWMMITFFCMGMIFGNINALAMEPLGHLAGLGAAFVGSVTTLISLPLAWMIGASFEGGVMPLVSGFAFYGFASLLVMNITEKKRTSVESVK
ncbi:MAG: multidrug effflux MFS transporter [Stappiaceae bacterium]